ncbi:MAG: AAA family ATPase, partial [Chloroflexi bacterium]|nr:AAA family ATPase [Chloroflexota bacterium]
MAVVSKDLLLALANGESGGTAVLEGEAGIGKSRLLADLFQQADRLRVGVLPGSADPVERSTPYYAWRGVFSRLLDVTLLSDPAARWRHIQDLLEFEPELQRLAPLLGPVLALDVPDNETTFQMTGQVRADNTREFLISLLQASANRSPKVLALEDAQWMDSASWALALAVSRRVRPLLLIVASRPLSDAEPPDFRRLVTAPDTRRIQLGMLSAEATAQLVRQRLGVTAAPESVEHLIYAKAGGHPFYSEELAGALLESGVVQVERGVAALAPGAGDIDQVQLPDSVSGVILSRIDRLSPQLQLTLKVASVIGRAFASHIVQDIHPIPTDRDRLFEYLTTLERLNWTMLEAAEPNVIYLFKHVITQEVAYNLMLYAQRRELHRAVAEWYEQTHAADLSPYYGLLAHHWSRAEDGVRAIAYLERAGELALHNFANQEAIALLSEALRWDAELGGQTPPASPVTVAQRARWERQLG